MPPTLRVRSTFSICGIVWPFLMNPKSPPLYLVERSSDTFGARKGLPGVVRNLGPPEVELAGRDFFSVDDGEGFGGSFRLVAAGAGYAEEESKTNRRLENITPFVQTHPPARHSARGPCQLRRKRSVFYHTMQGRARLFLFPGRRLSTRSPLRGVRTNGAW